MKNRLLALALSAITAVSAFAGFDITAFADTKTGSMIVISFTVTPKNYPETPTISASVANVTYRYDVINVATGELETKQITESLKLSKPSTLGDGSSVFLATEPLTEIISTREGYDTLKIDIDYYVNGKYYNCYESNVKYPFPNDVTIKREVEYQAPPPDVPRITPNWEKARIYCFEDTVNNIDYYDAPRACGGAIYSRTQGASIDIRDRVVVLYANGGNVENILGTKDNTKTKQLTLWETFSGLDAGTYNSTKSKQIAWIVTKDDKCPEDMKQKSDNSIVKVSKGKITALKPGDAYVWACRVDPNNAAKVSTTESARVHVRVEDAPAKVVLTHEYPVDGAVAVPIKKEELGVGEIKPIYIYMESKVDTLTYSQWRIEVTKGSEYLGVSPTNYNGSFSTRVTQPFRGDRRAMFYIKALGVKPDGKPASAVVTLTNLYTGKKTKLKVNISNAVVETTQPARDSDDLADLVVTSQTSNMSYALPNSILNRYYKSSAQKNLVETDENGDEVIPSEYAAIINSPTSDKPKIFVTSDTEVTREMIFKDTKSGLQVSFTGTKSKTVTAKWEMGFLQMNVKKHAAAEKGNIIIVFNKSHDMNGVLIVPYQVTSADPDNIPAAPTT